MKNLVIIAALALSTNAFASAGSTAAKKGASALRNASQAAKGARTATETGASVAQSAQGASSAARAGQIAKQKPFSSNPDNTAVSTDPSKLSCPNYAQLGIDSALVMDGMRSVDAGVGGDSCDNKFASGGRQILERALMIRAAGARALGGKAATSQQDLLAARDAMNAEALRLTGKQNVVQQTCEAGCNLASASVCAL